MGGKQVRKADPAVSAGLEAGVAASRMVGSFAGGRVAEVAEMGAGAFESASGGVKQDPLAGAKGLLGVKAGLAGLAGSKGAATVSGMAGKAVGVVKGAKTAFDSSKDLGERVGGGLYGLADGLQLGAKAAGHKGLFAAGTGVGGAGSLGASSATAALTAGGATSLAAAGAVVGAGAAGWGAGQAINQIAGSPHARQRPGAVGGTHQTYADWWQAKGAQIGGPAGVAVGTAGATFGTLVDAGVAVRNLVTGASRPRPSGGAAGSGKPAPAKPAPAPRSGSAAPNTRAGSARAAAARAAAAQASPKRGGSAGSGGSRSAAAAPPANPGGFWNSLRQAVGWGR